MRVFAFRLSASRHARYLGTMECDERALTMAQGGQILAGFMALPVLQRACVTRAYDPPYCPVCPCVGPRARPSCISPAIGIAACVRKSISEGEFVCSHMLTPQRAPRS